MCFSLKNDNGKLSEIPVSEQIPMQLVHEVTEIRDANCERNVYSNKSKLEANWMQSVRRLENTLRKVPKINSNTDKEAILVDIDDLIQYLPTTLTLQKILNVDASVIDWESFTEITYSHLLIEIIQRFDGNFPYENNTSNMYENVSILFAIENRHFFVTIVKTLLGMLNNKKRLNELLNLLERVLINDGLLDALLYYSFDVYDTSDVMKSDKNGKWEDLLQVLLSLPNRIANTTEGYVPSFFVTENYERHLFANLMKILHFFATFLHNKLNYNLKINYDNIALYLSKILLFYSNNRKSDNLQNFILILHNWTTKDVMCNSFKEIIFNTLKILQKNSINVMAVTILQTLCSGDDIHHVISDILEIPAWKYVFCTKIPLLSYYNHNEIGPIINLVSYVNRVSSKELSILFKNLLEIWSDSSALNHTSVEQHLFVSKHLILITRHLHCRENSDKIILEDTLRAGILAHLKSPLDIMRAIGMITCEILTAFLKKDEEHFQDIKLNFDYTDVSDASKTIVKNLKDVLLDSRQCTVETKDIQTLLVLFFGDYVRPNDHYKPPERQFRKRNIVDDPKNDVLSINIKSTSKLINIVDDQEFELDSDDDLEPYDLSNDLKVPKKQPPSYLRDLRDALLEKDPETFTASIEVALKIIKQQLVNDDHAIGTELLNILLVTIPPCHVENYDEIAFQCCTAITCVYPAIYAEYLARQFHTDTGVYSISHRIFILQVLGAAARSLSEIQKSEHHEGEAKKKVSGPSERHTAADIIRIRLEEKTRRFFKYKNVIYEQKNKFSESAGYFFYPLLHGFGGNYVSSSCTPKNDNDYILLLNYIDTISIIMRATQNCHIAPRMGKDALKFSWFLRFHKESKIRLAVLNLIASTVLSIPNSLLLTDFIDELLEIRLWLIDLLSPNVQRGEPNTECRILAENLACLLEGFLKL